MREPSSNPPAFPRLPLFGAFAAVAISLVAAIAGRVSDASATPPPGSPVIERELHFGDRSDGAVIVYIGPERRPLDVLTGENGFLRGTLRSLARSRRIEGVTLQAPFHLTGWSSGRLTLDDPLTGQRIELDAFGPTNTAVFARLLTLRGDTP